MDNSQKVLETVRSEGPLIPVTVANKLGISILLASAYLSDLVSKGSIKISRLKVGGSPVYYMQGQEYKLQNYADKLNEKEKKAYDLLRQAKILWDEKQVPVIRVALREITDFAKPLKATSEGAEKQFWRWYLLAEDDAKRMINQETQRETQPEQTKNKAAEARGTEKEETESSPKKDAEAEKDKTQKTTHLITDSPEKKTFSSPFSHFKSQQGNQAEKNEPENTTPDKTTQPRSVSQPAPAAQSGRDSADILMQDSFLRVVHAFFSRNDISIREQIIIKKSSEYDFIVLVPSAIGRIVYYAKAKKKKRYSDTDISAAYAQGQIRKLPVLFLITGELTKKAKQMFEKELLGIVVKSIE